MEDKGLCPFTYGRVADRVFSSVHGWGVIHRISYYPPLIGLIANFDNGESDRYTLSGYKEKSQYALTEEQELYWDEDLTRRPIMPAAVIARGTVAIEDMQIGFGG